MNLGDGIFVRTFRNREEFAKHTNDLEDKQKPTTPEEKRLYDLVAESGLPAPITESRFNPEVDPNLFYPELDTRNEWENKTYHAMAETVGNSLHTGCYSNLICDNRQIGAFNIPVEILEELSIANSVGFFEKIYCYHDWGYDGSRHLDFLFVGRKGKSYYPIVFWGPEKTWNKIEEKTAQIKAEKMEAEQVEKTPKPKRPKQPLVVKLGIILLAIFFLNGIAALIMPLVSKNVEHGLVEEFANGTKTVKCDECPKAVPRENLPVFESVQELPRGSVMALPNFTCKTCNTKAVWISTGRDFVWVRVTPKVAKMIKLGEEIPFLDEIRNHFDKFK